MAADGREKVAQPGGGVMFLHVVVEQAEDGWVVVRCPALPGCVSQGRDEQEALSNIREAIAAWLWAEDQKALATLPPADATPVLVSL